MSKNEQSSQPTPRKPHAQDYLAKKIPYFSNIPEQALSDLMGKSKTIRYIRKADLALEINKAHSLFIVFLGKGWVYISNNDKNREVTFHIKESNSSNGEIAVLTDTMRAVSVISLEKTVFTVISEIDFKQWLANHPDIKLIFL